MQPLQGRKKLCPAIPGRMFQAMLLQQRKELLLEANLTVVFPLRGDVRPDVLPLRGAHGEGAVSRLPGEALRRRELFVRPPRRIGLEHAEQIGQADRSRNREQKVNMIGRPIDDEGRRLHLSEDAAHIREEPAGEFGREDRGAVLG